MSESGLKPINDSTIREQVFNRLKGHIVSGQIPPGTRLTEQSIAASLKVSRGPLREAIRELVDIGLIVSIPYKGIFVRSVTRKDLDELYSLRTALETFAFQIAWDKRTPEALEDLKNRNAVLIATVDEGTDATLAIDQELHLHSWCYELSDHFLLLKSWKRMEPSLKFYFSLHQLAHDRPGPLRQAHDVYVGLACGEDLDLMLEHLKTHMRQGLEVTISLLSMNEHAVAP